MTRFCGRILARPINTPEQSTVPEKNQSLEDADKLSVASLAMVKLENALYPAELQVMVAPVMTAEQFCVGTIEETHVAVEVQLPEDTAFVAMYSANASDGKINKMTSNRLTASPP